MTVLPATLRSKFLLAFALISALLTCVTLLVVKRRVEVHVREEIQTGLRSSVETFRALQGQRETTLQRSSALLASLPTLKAVMTSRDAATIQDASTGFWKMSGSQLFVLADPAGTILAIDVSPAGFTAKDAEASLRKSLAQHLQRDWWFAKGHLYQVFLQPVTFGAESEGTQIGVLAVGFELDRAFAAEVGRVAASRVSFEYGGHVVVSSFPPNQSAELESRLTASHLSEATTFISIADERFLATSGLLSGNGSAPVKLTVLRSYDEATSFLQSLNSWILVVGVAAVIVGSALVFLVSTTFTRPLGKLAGGVRALEQGNFSYPLETQGRDEISELTGAFLRMRSRLQTAQRQLVESERLATIGRMASTISHDLRRPLTAILAYAEFLSESSLSDDKRKDFFEEIRIAVGRMTDELNSLLGFSKQREAIRLAHGLFGEVIERAIQTVKVLPEFQNIRIAFSPSGECEGWFDPGKAERVILNLLFNACEAVSPQSGKIDITCDALDSGIEITISDNGPGIPEPIRQDLFQPFVSYGKEKGIGLGLTAVQKIMENHGGEVHLARTGPSGTVFKLSFPGRYAQDEGRLLPSNEVLVKPS